MFLPLVIRKPLRAGLVIGIIVGGIMAFTRGNEAKIAWDRIEALGGHGVWDADMVVVSLAGTGVTDDDLILFEKFPAVQILDLSQTSVGDPGLTHLAKLHALELLVVVDTGISDKAIELFRNSHADVEVVTKPGPKDKINPFTGKIF